MNLKVGQRCGRSQHIADTFLIEGSDFIEFKRDFNFLTKSPYKPMLRAFGEEVEIERGGFVTGKP